MSEQGINFKVLSRFFQKLTERSKTNWVLLGGTVLPALETEYRVTIDIDIAPINKNTTNAQVLELMEIAQELGLPVEAINTSASFFLKKKKGFEKELVLLYQKGKVKIFRPNATLFISLKVQRLSESDLTDCLKMIDLVRNGKIKDVIDTSRLEKEISTELQDAVRDKKIRYQKLITQLQVSKL